MQVPATILYVFVLNAAFSSSIQSPCSKNAQISHVIRNAVMSADSSLLESSVLSDWRDYLKAAVQELPSELQPIFLIKFDQDTDFRHQLKTIIELNRNWEKKEIQHFIYYYRKENPPPEILLGLLDSYFNEIAQLFKLDKIEKIPYCYDVDTQKNRVYPFDDLRAGVVSANPFDFENVANAMFYSISSRPAFFIKALTKMYGTYFQNRAAANAYDDKCLEMIKPHNYVSVKQLYPLTADALMDQFWYSTYAFTYSLVTEFGEVRIKEFLQETACSQGFDAFQMLFSQHFQQSITDFETRFTQGKTADK